MDDFLTEWCLDGLYSKGTNVLGHATSFNMFLCRQKEILMCDNIILVKQKCVTLGMLKYTYSSEICRFYEYRKESKNGVKLGINVRGGNF